MQSLSSLVPIRLSGADAHSYLQGQLSNDLDSLTPRRSLLASCNSGQGRVQAVLHLIERKDGVVALLPPSLLELTLARLRKYVLRARLSIENMAESVQVRWADRSALIAQDWPVPSVPGEHLQHEDISILRWPDSMAERFVILHSGAPVAQPGTDAEWMLADIRAGLPQVFPETHEHFVAQMLNLDAVGGISFNKGCYTGQEIIARAHFRGAVKRRMFRLQAGCPAPPPGTRIVTRTLNQGELQQDEPAGEVVMAANTTAGCELLAVVSIAHSTRPLLLEGSQAPLEMLSLPYELPAAS